MNFKNFINESNDNSLKALEYMIVKSLGYQVKIKNGQLLVTGFDGERAEIAGGNEIKAEADKLKKLGKIMKSVEIRNDHFNKQVIVSLSD